MRLIRFTPNLEMALWPDRSFDFEPARMAAWYPPVDVSENDNKLTLKADLPEMDPKDLTIQVHDGELVLKGERKMDREENSDYYHRVERRYGSFARSFRLPDGVDPDSITADYDKGVLTVQILKREEAKPRQIEVKVGTAN